MKLVNIQELIFADEIGLLSDTEEKLQRKKKHNNISGRIKENKHRNKYR